MAGDAVGRHVLQNRVELVGTLCGVAVSVTFNGQVVRWVHIVAPIGLFGLDLVGLPTFPGCTTDPFRVGLAFNARSTRSAMSR